MTTLSQQDLDELLVYLEKSIKKLMDDAIQSLEFHQDSKEIENFLTNQFEVRLENMLQSKNSSIHHLESGMKNRVIQKRRELLVHLKTKLNA